jgi:hypothetical protein
MWWYVWRILIGLEQKCKQKRWLVQNEIHPCSGDHFRNPEAMTVKQLGSVLKDCGLLQQGNKLKKAELQKTLKT